jgi:peptide/nickel transport system permease protein
MASSIGRFRRGVADFLGRFRKGESAARIADFRYTLHLLRRNPLVIIGSAISIFFIFLALTANLIIDPNLAYNFNFARSYTWNNPYFSFGPGAATIGPPINYLGTDGYGRDLLQMIILAIPLDISLAFLITFAAMGIGITIGALAGYIGGVIDEAILRITDIFFAFPGLLLALVFAAIFGRGNIMILALAVLAVWWPTYVRLMRGQVLAEKEKIYVEALRALGVGHLRILFRHILPNSIYPILVQATLDLGGVILTFSALMFLGFSPSPALPELGNLASDGIAHVFTAPWLILFPGLTILTIALAFNLVGDGLRDALDPRLRR